MHVQYSSYAIRPVSEQEEKSHRPSLAEQIVDWLAYLKETDDEALIANIRKNTTTGRPSGDQYFVQTIEHITGRTLATLPRGRPRKK